jgi:hypothetical protein
MPDLINTFTWSYTAAHDFELCPRKRYWSKYAAWGGWEKQAPAISRSAYRLSKMESRHTLQGHAAEKCVRWLLAEAQAGRTHTPEETYDTIAKPYLNTAWKDSKSGAWRENPKRHTCLFEHYYPELNKELDPRWPEHIRETVLKCCANFTDKMLPDLAAVSPQDEIKLSAPESFDLDGLTVYVAPDYVYRLGESLYIVDWKTGRPRPEHAKQLALYALWAEHKHRQPPDRVVTVLAYLDQGVTVAEPATAAMLEDIRAWIVDSSFNMVEYLHNGDARANKPVPREEWDMTTDRRICEQCAFYELCRPEF